MVPIATELTQVPSGSRTVANGYALNSPPFLAVPETINGQPTLYAAPEPATWLLLASGLIFINAAYKGSWPIFKSKKR